MYEKRTCIFLEQHSRLTLSDPGYFRQLTIGGGGGALKIEKIEQLIKRQQLTLSRNALQGNSRARTFYMGMMKLYNQGNIDQYPASLLSRCKKNM